MRSAIARGVAAVGRTRGVELLCSPCSGRRSASTWCSLGVQRCYGEPAVTCGFCLDLAGWGKLLRRLQAAASAVSALNYVHSAPNHVRNRKRKCGLPREEPRMARAPHPQKPAAVLPS